MSGSAQGRGPVSESPSQGKKLGRRQFLVGGGALTVCALVAQLRGVSDANDYFLANRSYFHRVHPELREYLDECRLLGSYYLKKNPQESHGPFLYRTLFGDLEPRSGDFLAKACTRVGEAVQRDFEHGRTVEIDGWVLARTELRLCALTVV